MIDSSVENISNIVGCNCGDKRHSIIYCKNIRCGYETIETQVYHIKPKSFFNRLKNLFKNNFDFNISIFINRKEIGKAMNILSNFIEFKPIWKRNVDSEIQNNEYILYSDYWTIDNVFFSSIKLKLWNKLKYLFGGINIIYRQLFMFAKPNYKDPNEKNYYINEDYGDFI